MARDDRIFYIEPLYDGMTSAQRFQKELTEGKWIYRGKTRHIDEKRDHRYFHPVPLDGPPQLKKPLFSVELVEGDTYVRSDNPHYFYFTNHKILQTWTAVEWADLLHEKKITPDKLQEFQNSLCKIEGDS